MDRQKLSKFFLSMIVMTICASSVKAIIVFENPGRLTTMPVLTGGVMPGWQYLGQFGNFTGIPIGPRAWVTATHLNPSSATLFYDNAGTTATTGYASTLAATSGDLAVMILNGDQPSFTSWATLWSDPNSLTVNQSVYMYGRGTQRGAEVTNNYPTANTPKGWAWGAQDHVQSYGTNNIDGLALDSNNNVYLSMSFSTPGGSIPTTEGTFSTGDSGSGIFSYNPASGKWELVGVNTSVDVPQDSPNGSLVYAALYDLSGYYSGTTQITTPLAQNSYSTSIAHKYGFLAPFTVPEPSTWVMAVIASVTGLFLIYRRSPL